MARIRPEARGGKSGAGRVRIIGGAWRSRSITFPAAEGLRPTPDRVRETVFNWLGQSLEGKRCLDLFAGSGALGLEAASRHAAHVTLVEKQHRVFAALRENAARLGATQCTLIKDDALAWLRRDTAVYDVIFLDPPFAAALLPAVWPLVGPRLAGDGVVYLESGAPLALPEGWALFKSARAGMVYFGLACREPAEAL
ncbi:16S rRNA (guanine(966)-N(2))-methyltransferase RsmD [Thiobacter aerophilum]|uniref:16S rRNA (Guanine(966)-N(2))-methyltransferase RsmD n=1 Tax=Thiobacter aerophilum TaxID=3121275 RepID=A0ABV0EE80_9BURK